MNSIAVILFALQLMYPIGNAMRAKTASNDKEVNALLVLMLDGFKWDYLNLIPEELGGFSEFVENGVRAEYVKGVYPTLSYPSWTTLSTGLYPENHGILGNYFYSREEQTAFKLNSPNDQTFWWQTAEPIWTTATNNGLRVATILWSRSDVAVHEVLPEINEGYRIEKGWEAISGTLNKAANYLNSGFHLVMAYGEHIDNIGHKYGPKSQEIREALRNVGMVLENFFLQLTDLGLRDKVNVLIVSDHGMTDASKEAQTRHHQLKDYINSSNVEYIMDQGALAQIYTNYSHQVYKDLKRMEGINVYTRNNIPREFNFAKNDNAPDVLLVAEPGNLIIGTDGPKQIPEAWDSNIVQGVHGYNPLKVADMRTVFMATGPDFKKGVVRSPIDLVDIYQIYCHLLRVPPSPHNGTWSHVAEFLSETSYKAYSAADTAQITILLNVMTLTFLMLLNLDVFNVYF